VQNAKDFQSQKELYLRKSNEKIVTAYKLANVMLGMHKKNSPAIPSVTEGPKAPDSFLVSSNPSAMEIETVESGTKLLEPALDPVG